MASCPIAESDVDEELAAAVACRLESAAAEVAAQDALTQLYARHASSLLSFLAARVAHSDVEDVHQAIWQRVWERLPDRPRQTSWRGWLFTIARNYLIDRSRKKTPELLGDADQTSVDVAASPPDRLLEHERMAVLERCFERLEAEAAQLVRGRLAGQSYEHICLQTGLTTTRAHRMFHDAKHKLEHCVQQHL